MGTAAYGTTCADGTRFAGISPDGGGRMYVTPTTNSTSRQWFNAQSGTPIANCTTAPPAGTGTCSTGLDNTVTLAGLSTNYQAATLCRNLTYGGYNDWYLPSINELYVMQQNRVAIGGFNGQYYWSSTPQNSGNARYINFGPGLEISYAFKTQSYQVRCVRKE